MTTTKELTAQVLTPEELLKHWQGHRGLTRRMIEAFPEDKLFTYSVGGMRPFAELVLEFIGMGVPTLKGSATRVWERSEDIPADKRPAPPTTKKELLQRWDENTGAINKLWKEIPAERFQEDDLAFGQWPGKIYTIIFYIIDNEIHHRGQGYVYLRSLGIEPPAFWERE